MAITVIPARTLDIAGPLGSVIAMKQREKEINKTLALEKRKQKIAERYADIAEETQEIEKKKLGPLLAFQEAQTKHMGAQTDYLNTLAAQMTNEDLKRLKIARENEALLGDTAQRKLLQEKIKKNERLLEMMKSSDPEERGFATQVYFTDKYIPAIKDENDTLRTQAAVLNAMVNAMGHELNKSKVRFDMQNDSLMTLLAGSDIIKRAFGEDIYKDTIAQRLGEIGGIEYNPIPASDQLPWYKRALGFETPKATKKGESQTPEEELPFDLNVEGLLNEMRK